MWKQTQINPKYEVSDSGEVRTISSGHIKSQKTDRYGYKVVCLSESKNVRKYVTVHRLVAQAFIPNPQNLPQVNHKDEDKTNNHVSNLEWCDGYYNSHYGTGRERCDKSRCKPIVALKDGNEVQRFPSTKAASEALNINKATIRGVLKGKGKTAAGYEWAYERK